MDNARFDMLNSDETTKRIMNFIPNELGINLCSVDDVVVNRQTDGQITDIQIKFVPT